MALRQDKSYLVESRLVTLAGNDHNSLFDLFNRLREVYAGGFGASAMFMVTII